MTSISKDMISNHHDKIGLKRSEAYANLAMRFLRALINFAIAQHEDGNGHSVLSENPEMRPTQTRTWYRVDRRQMQKVIQLSGVSFTLHDLRRIFITIAESIDISAYALKRLINHKITNDVTAGYIVSDVERLRKPMEQITAQLLQYFKINEEKKILSFPLINNT